MKHPDLVIIGGGVRQDCRQPWPLRRAVRDILILERDRELGAS